MKSSWQNQKTVPMNVYELLNSFGKLFFACHEQVLSIWQHECNTCCGNWCKCTHHGKNAIKSSPQTKKLNSYSTISLKDDGKNTGMNSHILKVKCNHKTWPVMTNNFKIKLQITQQLFSTVTSKKAPAVLSTQSRAIWMPLNAHVSGTSNYCNEMNLEQMQRLKSSASRVSKWDKHTCNILKVR